MNTSINKGSKGRRAMRPVLISSSIALALAFSGCAAQPEANDPSGAEGQVDPYAPEVSLVKTVQYPNAGAAPLYAALDKGIAEEYGLDIEMTIGTTGPTILPQILTGDTPIGGLNSFFTTSAVVGGADIRIIGEMIRGVPNAHTIEALPDTDINELADFEGKRIGVQGLRGGHEAQLSYAMLQAGLDPSKVEFVSVGFDEAPAALEQGTVDAVSVTGPPFTEVREQLNSKMVFDYADGLYAEFPSLQYVASGAFVDANPNTVAAFQCSVIMRGAELVDTDQDVYEDMLKQIGMSDEAIALDMKLYFPAQNDAEHLQLGADMMLALGWIDQEFDVSSIVVPLPQNC